MFAEIVNNGAIRDPAKIETSRFDSGNIEEFGLAMEAAVAQIFAVSGPGRFVRRDNEVSHTKLAGVLHRFGQFRFG